jgi:hypothetical protein
VKFFDLQRIRNNIAFYSLLIILVWASIDSIFFVFDLFLRKVSIDGGVEYVLMYQFFAYAICLIIVSLFYIKFIFLKKRIIFNDLFYNVLILYTILNSCLLVFLILGIIADSHVKHYMRD